MAIPCAILGSYLVLRRMTMLGDAISHAVLPGIVIAFLITGSLSSLPLTLGAGLVGVVTTLLIELLRTRLKVQDDAAIGIASTALFAFGLVLVARYTANTDLDLDCVFLGDILAIPSAKWITESGYDLGPKPLWVLGSCGLLVGAVLRVGRRGFALISFDYDFAWSLGLRPGSWHFVLMALVSFESVVAFEALGAVLVVGFLVLPAATAHLLTERLVRMQWLAAGIGVLGVSMGVLLGSLVDGIATSSAMVLMLGLLFALAIVLSPKHGLFRRHFAARVAEGDRAH